MLRVLRNWLQTNKKKRKTPGLLHIIILVILYSNNHLNYKLYHEVHYSDLQQQGLTWGSYQMTLGWGRGGCLKDFANVGWSVLWFCMVQTPPKKCTVLHLLCATIYVAILPYTCAKIPRKLEPLTGKLWFSALNWADWELEKKSPALFCTDTYLPA